MATRSTSRKSASRDAPKITNFLNINGKLFSLGDLRQADFSSLEDPVASVNSLLAWAKSLNQILKGSQSAN